MNIVKKVLLMAGLVAMTGAFGLSGCSDQEETAVTGQEGKVLERIEPKPAETKPAPAANPAAAPRAMTPATQLSEKLQGKGWREVKSEDGTVLLLPPGMEAPNE